MPLVAIDAVAVLTLVALLAVAFAHPPEWLEGTVGVAAAALVVAVGGVRPSAAAAQIESLLPVVLFLCAILVVATLCAAEGVFRTLGALLARRSRGSGRRMLAWTFVVAAATTAALSLDATVVLLTPVAVLAAAGEGLDADPVAHVCARLANSASLLLPVSNLTNLLAMPVLGLTFHEFVVAMAPVWAVVLVVEYVGLRWFFRRSLAPAGAARGTAATGPPDDMDLPVEEPPGRDRVAQGPDEAAGVEPAPVEPDPRYPEPGDTDPRHPEPGDTDPRHPDPVVEPAPVVPLVVVALMLVGFAVGSPLGVEPAWVAGGAALVLAVHALRRRVVRPAQVLRATHVSFGLFVLGLGVVVAALVDGFLGDLVGALVPDGTGLAALLGIAVLATVLANLVNNLPATLVLVPLVAPGGVPAVLAALIGLNVGSGLTYPGSLANLLWRRSMTRVGEEPSTARFHALALLLTPPAVLAGTLTLWLTS